MSGNCKEAFTCPIPKVKKIPWYYNNCFVYGTKNPSTTYSENNTSRIVPIAKFYTIKALYLILKKVV